MSAYVRELLFDLVDGVSSCTDAWIDFQQALDQCLEKHLISEEHIYVLDRYLTGYTVQEIDRDVKGAYSKLIQVLAVLEQESQYTDDSFLERMLVKYPKYRKIKPALRRRLIKYSIDVERDNHDEVHV